MCACVLPRFLCFTSGSHWDRSDQKEAQATAYRDANPEATREAQPLELLKDRCPTGMPWQDGIVDPHNRSWMYLASEPSITSNDFAELQQKVVWRDFLKSGKVMRKTMWYTKPGCTCPYNYGHLRACGVAVNCCELRWLTDVD